MRPVVLRFRLGQGLVKARKESENTSRFVAQQLAVNYAEDTWEEAKGNLSKTIVGDVKVELARMAMNFRRHIIGAAGTSTAPNGTLTTAAKGAGAPSQRIAEGMPAWKARGTAYIERKRRNGAGIGWFDNSKWGKRQRPANAGLMKKTFSGGTGGSISLDSGGSGLSGGDVWEDMFGPVSVRVVRNNRATGSLPQVKTDRRKSIRLQVASIYVMALGKISLGMLKMDPSGNDGLNSLVRNYNPDLAVRLGRGRGGTYRHTMEPFLKFFLTRALPFAVQRRIEKGTIGSVFRRS